MSIKKSEDYYKTLQVHPEAGQEIIDIAYRALSKKYHPDINKHPQANEYMMEINLAYGILSEPLKRKRYNLERLRTIGSSAGVPTKAKEETAEASEGGEGPKAPFFRGKETAVPKSEALDRKSLEEAEAASVLERFFRLTAEESWEKAYGELTLLDRENVPLPDFIEWKEVVNKIYRLGSYQITFFKRFEHCEYAGHVYPLILQFSVSVKEMNQITSKVSEESTQKYVAYDGKSWRVCLGYRDLKPNTLKFKYMAQSLPRWDRETLMMKSMDKIDLLTGLYSGSRFREQAEREILRSKRYGNPLSIALIRVEPLDTDVGIPEETRRDAAVSYAADMLSKNIRRTDILARWSEEIFILLFTETKLAASKKALHKLLAQCSRGQEESSLSFGFHWSCRGFLQEDLDKTVEEALEKLQPWLGGETPLLTEEMVVEEEKTKLGKYGIKDILRFNQKGKNHF